FSHPRSLILFFFNDTTTTELYTLSLHDALPISVGAKDRKMGQEGAWTADVHFDGVRVPDSALVGGSEDVGYKAAMLSLARGRVQDRKSTRLNSSHVKISYAVFCLKKKKKQHKHK